MEHVGTYISEFGLENHGILDAKKVYWNLAPPLLYEQVVARNEGALSDLGQLVVSTGVYTGRSPKDKYVVEEPDVMEDIWWGPINQPISAQAFRSLRDRMLAHARQRDLFVFDGYAAADPKYRMPVRIITEYAWHSLFARSMFLREANGEKLRGHVPQFTVIDIPSFQADPQVDGTRSGTFILVNFAERQVLIGGTEYAGEIKKSVFTALNYYLPKQDVLSMHCSANYGAHKSDAALFFGLSGTGKTTLSNDPQRVLVGDDEHGWSDSGVFNFEGGCYAKVIRLDPQGEPEIYAATQRFGAVVENVVYDATTRQVDYNDASRTENTRSVYPITFLPKVDLGGQCGHPKHIVFLTADAFGVLPPISRLSKSQAMYHFLSGYTAKVAGTERGVTEPRPEFSACFGAPFLPLHPGKYARLLGERIDQYGAQVWLVNTGWTGGPHGVGRRIELAHTRRMVSALLAGELDEADIFTEPLFGLDIPTNIEGVPRQVLNPRSTWDDPRAYDRQAAQLVERFNENFKRFEDGVDEQVIAAGPSAVAV